MWAWIGVATAASYAYTMSQADAETLAKLMAFFADAAPPEQAGSLMTFQTALGFALTFATVQVTPMVACALGWPALLAILALGPAFGIASIMRLRTLAP